MAGENPAWAILRKVIENKSLNDRKRLAAYEYESYSRIELLLANVSDKMRNQRLIKDIEQSVSNLTLERDSSGAPRVPVFVSETLSKLFFRRDPKKMKEVILHTKAEGIGVTDQNILTEVLGATYSDFNFYQNWVRFLGKDLHSPIADGWQGTYKYILGDTLRKIDDRICYEIRFKPKVKYDLAFTGKVWIDTSTHALAKIDVYVSKDVNLNYIDEVSVSQVFQPIPNTTAWMPGTTRMRVNVAQITANSAGFIANIFLNNRTFLVDKPRDEAFFDVPIMRDDSLTEKKSETFWAEVRPEPLSKEELDRYAIIDSIKKCAARKKVDKNCPCHHNGSCADHKTS
ncbi:MAG: hypothetical protein HC817_01525 [Saprospiraceae bacterium]|nr:hypothetical protein [Saprospiraceae bacterium]